LAALAGRIHVLEAENISLLGELNTLKAENVSLWGKVCQQAVVQSFERH
jgi:hypothetical protein